MPKQLKSIFQYLIFLGLGIFLIWLSVKDLKPAEIEQLQDSLKKANYLLLIPVLGAVLLSHWSRAVRWKILMKPLGHTPSTTNTFFAVMVGYLANLAVPRLGEVLKCTILARYEKVPADKLIGTIVAERAFDLICLLIVIFLTIVTQLDKIGGFAMDLFRGNEKLSSLAQNLSNHWYWWVLIGLLLVVLIRGLLKRINKNENPSGLLLKVKTIVKGVAQGVMSVRYVENKGLFFFHTALIWALYLGSIRVGFYAMSATAHLGMPEALSILSFGSIAMIITQGGIGAYQYLIQKVMRVYALNDVEGLAFGWLLWGAQTIIVLLIGLLCLSLLPVFNRKPVQKQV
jgi:uncharacterized membrane protein YbhN (UPF0104 family)